MLKEKDVLNTQRSVPKRSHVQNDEIILALLVMVRRWQRFSY